MMLTVLRAMGLMAKATARQHPRWRFCRRTWHP